MAKFNKNVFESALQKTARTISSKYDVNIIFDGNTVKKATPTASGKTIILPSTIELLEEKDQNLLAGFLDHEVGHVMFTDWDSLDKAFKGKEEDPETPYDHLFWNLLEDVSIEDKIRRTFPGVGENLDFMHKAMLDENEEKVQTMDLKDGSFDKILIYMIAYSANNCSFEHPLFDNLSQLEKVAIANFGEKYLKNAVGKSTDWCLTAGKELKQEMYAAFGQPPPGKKPKTIEVKDIIERSLDSLHNSNTDNGKYLIYSTKHDEIKKVSVRDPVEFKTLKDSSARSVNVIRQRLIKYIQTKKNILWETGKTSGALNQRAYVNAYLGVSNNIFKKKIQTRAVNTVFDIMIDHSGSMASKMKLAVETAVALGEILNLCGVPFAVRGFTTRGVSSHYEAVQNDEKLSEIFSRFGALRIPIYKDYSDSWKSVGASLPCALYDREKNNTYDGESLRYSINCLIDRPEPRKILFWLNDGAPCSMPHDNQEKSNKFLLDVIKEGEKRVEIIAFGIGTDNVKDYFKNYVVMNSIGDLAEVAMTKLSEILFNNQIKLGL